VIRTRLRRDDSGAVLLLTSIMMVVLLGMGALVIDVGRFYVERRELQNGADAAALAVAQDCAGGSCGGATATARTYANANARDGKAGIGELCGSGPGLLACATNPPNVPAKNWVKVRTVTPDDNQVQYVLAPVLGHDAGKTSATAVASWGTVGSATTIPVAFSVCEFKALGGTIDGSQFPTQTGYVYLHGDGPDHGGCLTTPSGLKLPGGFGWLDQTGSCTASVSTGGWAGSDNGNDFPPNCDVTKWQNAKVLVPLYDQTQLSGSNGQYHVVGFAEFKVLAYKLKPGAWNMPGNGKCPGTTGNSGMCLYGQFSHFVTTSGQTGTGPDFGATVVQMAG